LRKLSPKKRRTTRPVLAPLGDLVGITRQTNVFIPTQG
jgi:uncharacterized ion transporter superfamily protein YfcC